MAQAKTRAATKSDSSRSSQKSRSGSRGSSSKSRASKPARSKAMGNGGKARVKSAPKAVGHTAKDAGQAVSRVAGKAKVPLVAGGAALAGAAGGLALGMRQGGRFRRPKVKLGPQVKLSSRDLAKASKQVGKFGVQVGHLASEVQRSREGQNGASKGRSPVEVVLQGLTARR